MKQAIGRGPPVHLILREVSTIDENGCGLLGRLAANGVCLSAYGVYSSYVIEEAGKFATKALPAPAPWY